jgi:hypothetical protein
MIKNRYYKTTPGVSYEFAVGQNLPVAGSATAVKMSDIVAASVPGNIYIMREAVDNAQPYAVIVNTALASAYKKQPIFVTYVTEDADGKPLMKNTISLVAETITAEVMPYTAPAAHQVRLENSGVGVVSTLQELAFKVIETTPGNVPLPTWPFNESLSLGEDAAFARIAAKINLANDEEFFTAVAGSGSITITSNDATRHFKLVAVINPTKADNSDTGVSYISTVLTQAKAGNGTLDQVKELYYYANIKEGVSHFYPQQGTNPAEFGLPMALTSIVGSTATFDIVRLTGYRTEYSPTPKGSHTQENHIFIAVPVGEGAKIAAIFA